MRSGMYRCSTAALAVMLLCAARPQGLTPDHPFRISLSVSPLSLATSFGPLWPRDLAHQSKQNRVALFWLVEISRKELPVGLESQSGTVRDDPARIQRGRRNNPRCGPEIGGAPADGARGHPECHPSAAQENPAPTNKAGARGYSVHPQRAGARSAGAAEA